MEDIYTNLVYILHIYNDNTIKTISNIFKKELDKSESLKEKIINLKDGINNINERECAYRYIKEYNKVMESI